MKSSLLNGFTPVIFSTSFATAITQKWLFSDIEYLKWLLIAVSLDLLTGIAKVWYKEGLKAITSKGIRMTVMKFIQYGSFLIITHVLSNFTVGGEKVSPLGFIQSWAYILLILIEIKSVYENIVTIDNRLDFVKGIIENLGKIIKQKSENNENKTQ